MYQKIKNFTPDTDTTYTELGINGVSVFLTGDNYEVQARIVIDYAQLKEGDVIVQDENDSDVYMVNPKYRNRQHNIGEMITTAEELKSKIGLYHINDFFGVYGNYMSNDDGKQELYNKLAQVVGLDENHTLKNFLYSILTRYTPSEADKLKLDVFNGEIVDELEPDWDLEYTSYRAMEKSQADKTLEDQVEDFVDEQADLDKNSFVARYFNRQEAIDDIIDQDSYGHISRYDGNYEEVDFEGESYVVFRED